ncbi:retrovirus-related pol polyprotein from transposon TNT 1-94 [Tanacetum coccineum]
MDNTRAQQKAPDDELVAPANHPKIGKSNLRLSSNLKSKEPTLQVVLDALKLTPFYKAFEITADVPEIYMQEFWVTVSRHHSSLRFKLNGKSHTVNVDNFRDMLKIFPKLPGKIFEEPPLEEEILSFIRDLEHTGEIKFLSDVNVNRMHQPWRSFAAIINKCLSGKTTALENYFMAKDQAIPWRNKMFWHYARDDFMFTTIRVISKHQDTQVYGVILPQHLTNQAMLESEAYKTYLAYATDEKIPKPKYVKNKADSESSPKKKTANIAKGKRLKTSEKAVKPAKKKKPAKASKAKGLTVLSEVALTEAEQIKLATKRSLIETHSSHTNDSVVVPSEVALTKAKQIKLATKRSLMQTHSSHASGSGADKGTGSIPGVPDVPTYKSNDDQISWKLREDDDDDNEDDDDNDDDGNNDDDDNDDDADNQDVENQDDDDEQTDSDNDGDDFVHPKFSTHDEEDKEEDSFDPRVQTPSHIESTDDEDSDEEFQDANVEGDKMNEEETNEEAEVDALYKDVNVNLEGRNYEMTDAPRTIVQTTQVIEDTHVIITPVNPEGQQQSSSVSYGLVSNMLNPSPDTGIDSLFNLNTESTSLIDVPVTTFAEPPLLSATTLPLPPTPLITHLQQTPVPTPPTVPSSSLQDLPNFGSLFGFDHRLKTLENNFSEFNQMNQFAVAVSLIPSIVDAYLANKMHEAVKTVVQLQSERLRDEAQAENADFLNKLDDNIKKIIKDQVKEQVKAQVSKILPKIEKTINEQLEAEVLTRSSNESKTSHVVAANLSELGLKKILIDKMESNKSIHKSDEQKNLYKALVDAYESDKLMTLMEIMFCLKDVEMMRIKTKNPLLDQTEGLREDELEKNQSQLVHQRKRHPRHLESHMKGPNLNTRLLANLLKVSEVTNRSSTSQADTYRSDLKRREAYSAYSNPRGFIYQNKDKKNRLMRIDELHKFSDGTLNDVRTALNDRLKGNLDKVSASDYLETKCIEDYKTGDISGLLTTQLKNRRIMRRLERFIGGDFDDLDLQCVRTTQTSVGIPVKEILLKLNLPDHRLILMDSKGYCTNTGDRNKAITNKAVNTAHDVPAARSKGQASSSTYADDVMFSFFINQFNSPQLDNKDLEQIDTDDLEEMDLKWQVAMLTMRVKKLLKKTERNLNFNGKETVGFDKTKVECYNCHRRCHFARECKAPRNQGNRNRVAPRRIVPVETLANALVVQDGICGYDWSYQVKEGPTDFALMAHLSSGSSSSSSSNTELTKLINSQISVNNKSGVGFNSQMNENELHDCHLNKSKVFESASDSSVNEIEEENNQVNDRFKKVEGYHAVPPPYTMELHALRPDLSFVNLMILSIKTNNKPSYAKINFVKSDENTRKSVIEQHTYRQAENLRKSQIATKSGLVPVNAAKQSASRASTSISIARHENAVSPHHDGFRDHREKLSDLSPKTMDLHAYKDLTMLILKADQAIWQGSPLNETECLVLSPDFKLLDESQVLLKVPRQNNMYSFDLKNVVLSGERKLHINFLENKPNVARSGPDWLFDIDLLTNSMNYKPVTAGNQTNKNAGIKDNVDAVPTQQYILILLYDSLQSSKDVVADDAGKKTNKEPTHEGERNGQEKEGGASNKENDHNVQDFRSELDNLLVQQKEGYANSTNRDSTVSPSVSTAGQNFTNAYDLPTDSLILDLEDTSIFSGAYDNEDVGAEADLNNLEITMNVSPIPTTRIHKDHPKDQIIGDINSSTQTRRMTKITEEHAMVWTLVDLPKGKRAIGTKWVYRNKKDERGIIVRNKARLVAQGYTQEKGINYDNVFAPIARIEAISQDKYVADILKKFNFVTVKTASTPIETNKALLKDEEAKDVDRIFRYLKGQPKLGLWYPRDSPFDLEAFFDSDYAEANLDR